MISERDRATIYRIRELKRKKRAIILVHNYQRKEIYEVADFIGDSLGLCVKASEVRDARLIVFSGVNFMAESAAVLNPDKKVVVPSAQAGCAMSDMITAQSLREKKREFPGAGVVCYVNSTAAVKAEADICCTSSNAVTVTQSMPHKQILFVPDKNLAAFVARSVKDKEIIAWDGYCPIHHRITGDYLKRAMADKPGIKLIAHPECRPEVIDMADTVESTSGMVDFARKSPANEFMVITECGMVNRLKRELPDKKFYTVCSVCFDMKKNTLDLIEDALLNETNEVKVDPKVRAGAERALRKMFDVCGMPAKVMAPEPALV